MKTDASLGNNFDLIIFPDFFFLLKLVQTESQEAATICVI
jgi:hypothetical protein